MFVVMSVDKWEDLEIKGFPLKFGCGIEDCVGYIPVFGTYEGALQHKNNKPNPQKHSILQLREVNHDTN